MSAWTGARIGSLIELRWRDVAWADARQHVRLAWSRGGVKGTKGGHGRPRPGQRHAERLTAPFAAAEGAGDPARDRCLNSGTFPRAERT